MGQPGGARVRSRAREALVVFAGVAVVIAVVIGVLSVTVLPPVLANLSSEAVETDTVTPLVEDGDATVLVPAGWVMQRAPFGDRTLRLRSPDAQLTVSIAPSGAPLQDAFDDQVRETDTVGAGAVTERLASGLDARHAFTDAGFVAAVGRADGAAVVVTAEAAPGADIAAYATALALILDGLALEAGPAA